MPLFNAERSMYDIVTLWGSAGSGKSRWIVQRFVTKMLSKKKRRYVMIRKVADTLRRSVYQEFLDVISSWNLDSRFKCTVNPMRIVNIKTGSEVIFMGLDSREKIKSLAAADEMFIEEITELEMLDFLQVLTRIRGLGKEGDKKLIWAAFNPVDEEHWVKSVLIDRKNGDKNFKNLKIYHKHTTWRDNKFVGKDYEAKLNMVGEFDPNYYNIYSLGLWGSIKPDFPFFYKFSEERNVNGHLKKYGREVQYDPNYAIYLSFDFNKRNSCVVSQKDFEKGYFAYLEEINEPVGFDLTDLVNRIIDDYGDNNYFITGDPSGNSASAFSQKNISAYVQIKNAFRDRGLEHRCNTKNVSVTPLDYKNSKAICNMLLTREEMWFSKNMKMTLRDVRKMMQDGLGGLDKNHCNKHDYGHLGDCVRYDMAFHFYKRYTSYKLQMKGYDLEKLKFKGQKDE